MSMFFKKKNKIISGYLLFSQLFFPTFSCLSSVTDAIEKSSTGDVAAEKNNAFLLPDLGSTEALFQENPEKNWASSAKQWAGLLSSDDVANTSVNYVKSVGANLASEQINHWLSQYGASRFSIDTDKNIAGDLLLPVTDNSSRLFFMQLGLRTSRDRNTTNLGLGYRQYWQNWIYGLNTFYDYDYKGDNARFGVGLEALTDYLKLATNGYFGLTDWHQSKLYVMHDEKPASGFDLRAEAYLPAYPQLGARIRYEKYFGKGIQLATRDATDGLKGSPHSLTLGLSYTPIPLLTVTGDHTVGDRRDTKMGLGVTYRLGVPLRQQLDRDAVNKMRYLGSNKYDFVDRNYDIVMQYKKRRGLNISLPEKIAGKEAEIITVSATINRGEDELAEIVWTPSSDFSENGGKIREVSKTSLEITLPHTEKQSNSSEEYYIDAVAFDNDGNKSNKATAEIEVAPLVLDIASARIADGDFIVITDNQPADGKAENQLKAVVTDSQGNKVSGIAVAFSADNGASPATKSITTNDAGEALYSVTNTRAGKVTITAKVGDKVAQKTVTFIMESKDFAGISVSDYTFDVHSGFPKTGIRGARMKLLLDGDYQPQDFEWKTNQNWMKMNSSGEVTFVDKPGKNDVVITAMAKNGGVTFEYKFKIDKVYEASDLGTWEELKDYCSDGYPLEVDISTRKRGVGKLWDEWQYYSVSGGIHKMYNDNLWLSEPSYDGKLHPVLSLEKGDKAYASDSERAYAVCLIK